MSIPARFREAASQFLGTEGAAIRYYRAPARVNVIGEHTDYNDGFVLPAATALYTWLGIVPRADRTVEVMSRNVHGSEIFYLDALNPVKDVTWVDYVKGVAAVLERNGVKLRGANIIVDSEIPLGGGLSSSASLELIIARALVDLANEIVPAIELAKICQQAEHEFANVQCCIMDQYTVARARRFRTAARLSLSRRS